MQLEVNHIYHIFNKGNNSQKIFYTNENYIFFLKKIRLYILPFADILAWCLMPNHFHLMVYLNRGEIEIENNLAKSKDKYGVKWGTISNSTRNFSSSVAIMLRSYTRAINNQEKRTGALFQMSTKAKCLTDNSELTPAYFQSKFGTLIDITDPEKSYPQICFRYIHQNPVGANLVLKPSDWIFSSYRDCADLRDGRLINRDRIKEFELEI